MAKFLCFSISLFFSLTAFAQPRTGMASYYHTKFSGKKTASGDIFNNQKMTAASNHFSLGDWVKVTNLQTGKSVFVVINDRMAKNSPRLIDLTHAAAKHLNFLDRGICRVSVEKCVRPDGLAEKESESLADTSGVIR